MGLFTVKTPVEKELAKVQKQEEKFLEKRREKKESKLNNFLEENVPAKMQEKLDEAFAKAFNMILTKGTGVIEKTYKREALEGQYKFKEAVAEEKDDRRSLKAFSKEADLTGKKNLLLSGATGIGMGLLGIGIPDIPVFTGMILKQIYETSLNYGFEYQDEDEQYFALLLIQGSVSYGEKLEEINEQLNLYIKTERKPDYVDMEKLIEQTAGYLSKELLYMKFLQGIPVAGAVGGAYDAIYMKRIAEYSELKFRRRFYEKRK